VSAGDDSTIRALDATTPDEPVATRPSLRRGMSVGRYAIIRTLGRGGMGTVYAAHDPQLDRQVALKLLHHTSASPKSLIDEAKALARLDDPHVVQVFDAGEQDGEVFVAMQLVDGEDLARVLATRTPKPAQILSWFVDAGHGLAAAHAAGLVHRDFKPSNVLIDRRGRVAVTDFGLAVNTRADSEADRADRLAGTPSYMAPEQHNAEAASPASDQFAFCVALWEALFGQHPFVAGDRTSMSPFEIGAAIFDGSLIPPPRGARAARVPRRVVDILLRGMARAPAERWPTMPALIAELQRATRRRAWPALVAAGVVVAALGGAAVWVLGGGAIGGDEASCEELASQRIDAAWSPATIARLATSLAASGRSYATATATATTDTLQRYASKWQALATETCHAQRDAGQVVDVVARQRACLDSSLDAFGDITAALGGAAPGSAAAERRVVDRAPELLAALPTLADCADAKAMAAGPGVPPPAIAAAVRALDAELEAVRVRQVASSPHEIDAARRLAARADALGWQPTQAKAHAVLGIALSDASQPALDELMHAGELAVAAHADRLAVTTWSQAIYEAGKARKPDLIAMLVATARSTAARLGPSESLGVEVSYARALTAIERWNDALAICRPAIAEAEELGNTRLADLARDCVFEALVPAGRYAELVAVVDERVATATAEFGPDYPPLAMYLTIVAQLETGAGKLAEARRDIDRAERIVTAAYPGRDTNEVAHVLHQRGSVEEAEGNVPRALVTFREAFAIAKRSTVEDLVLLSGLEQSIAIASMELDDKPTARAAFADAVALSRAKDPHSVQLALLLLNAGQLEAETDYPGAMREFGEAHDILDGLHDPRIAWASGTMAAAESQHGDWIAARAHAEEAHAHDLVDPSAGPYNIAEVDVVLAKAIWETKGDRAQARQLMRDARDTFAKLGPSATGDLDTANHWLATHP
jgi:tetratricopeptide (TPR) repeat protein